MAVAACNRVHDDTEDPSVTRQAHILPVPKDLVVSIATPPTISATQVGLGASSRLVVYPGANVGGAALAPLIATNLGAYGVRVDPEGIVGEVWSAGPVDMRSRAKAIGTIHSCRKSHARPGRRGCRLGPTPGAHAAEDPLLEGYLSICFEGRGKG